MYSVQQTIVQYLRHQSSVLVLGVGVVFPPARHLLLLLHHPRVKHGVPGGVDRQPGVRVGAVVVPEGLVVVPVVSGPAVPQYAECVDVTRHEISPRHTLVSSLCNGDTQYETFHNVDIQSQVTLGLY